MPGLTRKSYTTDDARKLFGELADGFVVRDADQLVHSGEAAWREDPEVEGVFGLIYAGTNHAAVIVYMNEEDFESEL